MPGPMGITHPGEPYFKDGVWGWDGTQWRKLSLVWGYSDTYAEDELDDDADAGTNSYSFATVPTGEVWMIQSYVMRNLNSICDMLFRAFHPAGVMILDFQGNAVAGHCYLCRATPLALPPGSYLAPRFTGCTAGDQLRVYAWGYKMAIAE